MASRPSFTQAMRRRSTIGAITLAVIAALANAPGAAAASSGRVAGQVSVDGRPVAEASVTLAPTKTKQAEKSTQTNSKGQYSFGRVSPGRYDLSVVFRFLPGSATTVKCKYGKDYSGFGVTATLSGGTRIVVTQLTSKKPFELNAGQKVERDLEVDCSPNVRPDTAPTSRPAATTALTRVSGRLSVDGDPVPGAFVFLSDWPADLSSPRLRPLHQTQSDTKGRYSFDNPAEGRYSLQAVVRLAAPQQSEGSLRCAAKGYVTQFSRGASVGPSHPGMVLAGGRVVWNRPLDVKVGKQVERNIAVDCEPDLDAAGGIILGAT